jgi:hypothetical protein
MHALFRHRRNDEPTENPAEHSWTPCSVRILHGEEELRAALERATGFEQVLMSQATARANRYSRLTPPVDRTAPQVHVPPWPETSGARDPA